MPLNDGDKLATPEQDAWVALTNAMRNKLAEMVQYMPAMKPDEVRTFIGAASDLHSLEYLSHLHDHDMSIRLAKVATSFGGD